MKKHLLLLIIAICGALSASAISPHYKGYASVTLGGIYPSNNHDIDHSSMGIQTSHGVELIDGLFLGAGLNLQVTFNGEDAVGSLFTDVRYSFLRTKRFSPYVGYKVGVGYTSFMDNMMFYMSPEVGCRFDLTKRFGFDVGLVYDLYSGTDTSYDYTKVKHVAVNCISLRLGVHF